MTARGDEARERTSDPGRADDGAAGPRTPGDAAQTREDWRLRGRPRPEDEVLLRAVLRGPRRQRDIFLLSRYAGWSRQSIANHLNISVKAVECGLSETLARYARRTEATRRRPWTERARRILMFARRLTGSRG